MKEIISDSKLVAYCGLYCGACRAYIKERCPGCHENEKATWCKIRICCSENGYVSCADCKQYTNPMECKLFNNFMSKIFGFVFRSNRAACIQQIQDIGIEKHADIMAEYKFHSLPR